MNRTYYYDYWHYLDPNGKEYTQEEFQKYLNENFPKKSSWDYSTHAEAEQTLTTKGGWRKTVNPPKKPSLAEAAGSYMVVSQFCEPRYYKWTDDKKHTGHWVPLTWDELDDSWWASARPDLFDHEETRWGHSTWFVNHDGTFTFTGADYDSSD